MSQSQGSLKKSVFEIVVESLIYSLIAGFGFYVLSMFFSGFFALVLVSCLIFSIEFVRALYFSGAQSGSRIKLGALTLSAMAVVVSGGILVVTSSPLFVAGFLGFMMFVARGWDSNWSSITWLVEFFNAFISGIAAIIVFQLTGSTFLLMWTFFLTNGTTTYMYSSFSKSLGEEAKKNKLQNNHQSHAPNGLDSQGVGLETQFDRAERQALQAIEAIKIHQG